MIKINLQTLCVSLLVTLLFGCHADPTDPEGQAKELSDPVRRENAIVNLTKIYSDTLANNGGDRSHADVTKVSGQVAGKLSAAYIAHPEDSQNGLRMLELMGEMRDPATLPALIKALNWRMEVTEEHAVRAANTLQFMTIPADKKSEVIKAISEALLKVSGARPVDNRMRINFINALGALKDKAATATLITVATAQTEEQDFRINRLAAQRLGEIADPAAIPALIKGLFLFSPSNPGMKMNDIAAEALIRIGRPALEPVLNVLKGKDKTANEITKAYIAAVRQRAPEAAATMKTEALVGGEATFTLGALGFAEALQPLLAETNTDDPARKANAAIALVRLNLNDGQRATVRQTLIRVFSEMPEDAMGVGMRAQLLAAMGHAYDAGYLPFFMNTLKNTEQHPQVRLQAVTAYSSLADKKQANALVGFIRSATKDAYQDNFRNSSKTSIDTAKACDTSLDCYIGKLNDSDKAVVNKAAYMVGRLGRGNEKAIGALVGKLNHMEIETRLAAVSALDHVASKGSETAVKKIDELRKEEEGRSVWKQFSREALPIQARIRARMN